MIQSFISLRKCNKKCLIFRIKRSHCKSQRLMIIKNQNRICQRIFDFHDNLVSITSLTLVMTLTLLRVRSLRSTSPYGKFAVLKFFSLVAVVRNTSFALTNQVSLVQNFAKKKELFRVPLKSFSISSCVSKGSK